MQKEPARMARIGRYQIISELGRGAMGVIYRARDPKLGRDLAIKTIRLEEHVEASDIAGLRDRLFREAQSAGRLSHPGIVTIFDADEEHGMAYFTMELVEGQSLADYRANDLPFDAKVDLADDLLRLAGSALDYAHASGVVHRDIKPSNLMITVDGVKIMDFGVAHLSSSQLTRTGTVVGTPNYMSPEQVQGESVDGRSDQFSLGVITYEILTGRKPFESENITSTLFKLAHEDPVPIREIEPRVSRDMQAAVMRALEKRAEARFDSCAAFAVVFSRAARSQASPVLSPARPSVGLPTVEVDRPSLPVDSSHDPLELSLPDRRDLLPVPSPALEETHQLDDERPSRWPVVIFVLLLCAIGALSVLLVRYPGFLDDPLGLLELIVRPDPQGRSDAGWPPHQLPQPGTHGWTSWSAGLPATLAGFRSRNTTKESGSRPLKRNLRHHAGTSHMEDSPRGSQRWPDSLPHVQPASFIAFFPRLLTAPLGSKNSR